MSKPTEEPTNQDINDNTRPGSVDLRTPITKDKIEKSTEEYLKFLDENVKERVDTLLTILI